MTASLDGFEWVLRHGSLAMELNLLLGITFVHGDKYHSSPIGVSLRRVVEFHNRGRFDYRDTELAELTFLTYNLRTINDYDQELFAYFRRELLCSNSIDLYYGTRFEVAICSSFIKNGIPFIAGRKKFPDFSITKTEEDISVECVSLHFAHQRKLRVLRKSAERNAQKG